MPRIDELPPAPPGRSGWPWTSEDPIATQSAEKASTLPRISIVTPSFNQGSFIEETIRSVLLQNYPNLEYIVMDGGSTDETLNILQKYNDWISHWESAPDLGQSDAINKGLSVATGHWFQNINSDDILLPNALHTVGAYRSEVDAVLGDVIEFSAFEPDYYVKNLNVSVQGLLRSRRRTEKVSWHQPGVFFRRDHLLQLGGYRRDLQYVFDFEMTCRYLEQFSHLEYTNAPLVKFRIHDAAKSSSLREIFNQEAIRARELLCVSLRSMRHRELAHFEANRRKLYAAIRDIKGVRFGSDFVDLLSETLSRSPKLGFDRFIFGFLRRRPALALRILKKCVKLSMRRAS